ncbi:MAG: dephospho-CoA kinase [Candidatus Aminicenantes bacterium]|nr:dephospho-CoA kinase [Candidatus Aminicenantes bacterium]
MFKIGLTGGICTGKTFVLNLLKELGCYTICADDIAKKILFSDNSGISKEIAKVFGENIYDKKKGLKKEEFSRILFEDAEKRNFINNFVHPMVTDERNKIINDLSETKAFAFFIYESALLVEAGTYKDFEKIIVVYTNRDEQLKRLMERDGIGRQDAEARIKAQFPLSEKLKVAHYTIDTSGTFEQAKAKTLETFHLMKKEYKIP